MGQLSLTIEKTKSEIKEVSDILKKVKNPNPEKVKYISYLIDRIDNNVDIALLFLKRY